MEQVIGYTLGQASRRQPVTEGQNGLALLQLWYARVCQRYALRQLDDHLLADIGLTRAEADAEARKPFWAA